MISSAIVHKGSLYHEMHLNKDKVYYWSVVIAALICWSPFNALAYVAPFLVLGMLIIAERQGRILRRALAWMWFWLAMVAVYGLLNPEFQFGNAFVAFVTWAGLIVILLIPAGEFNSPILRHKLEKFAWKVLLVESVWGIVQGIYGYFHTGSFDLANGDYVEGTIHPPLAPELAYSNVMFAINIALLLLFLLPALWRRKTVRHGVIYGLGLLAFVMASVVHAILFLLVAGGISAVLVWGRRPRLSRVMGTTVVLMAAGAIAWMLLPTNLGTVRPFAQQVLRGEVPKSVSVVTALYEMPREYPYMPIVGLGPGQYASRAGLISTGLYFGGLDNPRPVPLLPNRLTEAQDKYLLPLWAWHSSNPYWGSTQKPYFSWLAIYTEFGLFGWFVVIVLFFRFLNQIRVLPSVVDLEKFVLFASFIFIFMLGFQENNWEVPQAWFSGLLFIKSLKPNIRNKNEAYALGY